MSLRPSPPPPATCPSRPPCNATASRPLRTAPPRSVGLSRTALFFRLARRQNPLQTNCRRHSVGGFAARPQYARLPSLLRPPRQAPLRRPPLSRFLFCGAGSVDVFRVRPVDDHQRSRGQPVADHEGLFSEADPAYFRRALRPRGLRHWILRIGFV